MTKYENIKKINMEFRLRKSNPKFKNFPIKTIDIKKQTKSTSVQTKQQIGTRNAQTQTKASKTSIEALKKINKCFLEDIGKFKSEINSFKDFINNDVDIKARYEEFLKKKAEADLKELEY